MYRVTLTVTDDEGAWNSDSTIGLDEAMVVVFDASAGFVTGGGWINSPAGAYTADLTLSGKANFGFVSKYQRGATTPVGQTEFQFKAGSFNFHSSSYEWLVVAGARAIYKGSGTVNGAGDYGFQLSAIDGQVNGGGVDKFRIKVWDKANNDAVVYHNQMGDAIDADPTTTVGGGSIVIHTGGQPLRAADGAAEGGAVAVLTDAELEPIVAEAIRRWAAAGLDADRLAALGAVQVQTTDLFGPYLGLAFAGANTIQIDTDAAGYGWFVDPTPGRRRRIPPGRRPGRTRAHGPAEHGHHELGHMIGLDDLHGAEHSDDLMGEALMVGSRRVPTAEEVAEVTSSSAPEAPVTDASTPTTSPALFWLAPATTTPAVPATGSDAVRAERAAPPVVPAPDLPAVAKPEDFAASEWLLPPVLGDETVAESLWDVGEGEGV